MFYFSKSLGSDRILCLSPITSRLLARCDSELTDVSGYFLFEQKGITEPESVRILAQVHTNEAALALRDMMGLN